MTFPTKVAAPEGVAVVGSNRRWPRLSPSAAKFTPAYHPKQRPALQKLRRRSTTSSRGVEGSDGPAPPRPLQRAPTVAVR